MSRMIRVNSGEIDQRKTTYVYQWTFEMIVGRVSHQLSFYLLIDCK